MLEQRKIDSLDQAFVWNLCDLKVPIALVSKVYKKNISLRSLSAMSDKELGDAFGNPTESILCKVQARISECKPKDIFDLSLYYLCASGLRDTYARANSEKGLMYFMAPFITPEYGKSRFGMTTNVVDCVREAYSQSLLDLASAWTGSELQKKLHEALPEELIHAAFKTEIYGAIMKSDKPMSYFTLESGVSAPFNDEEYCFKCVSELVSEKKIQYVPEGIEKVYPTILDYINTVHGTKERQILLARVKGHKLAAIGKENCISSQRVDQIIKKYMEKRPTLLEDTFSGYFRKFAFRRDEFIQIFNLKVDSYIYLKLYYQSGTADIHELLDDPEFPSEYRINLEMIIQKRQLTVGNSTIPISRKDILDYIIRTRCNDSMNVEQLRAEYLAFLEEHHLQNRQNLLLDPRYLENRLFERQDILPDRHRTFRYFDYENRGCGRNPGQCKLIRRCPYVQSRTGEQGSRVLLSGW